MKTTMTLKEISALRPTSSLWNTLTGALGSTAPETVVDLRTVLSSSGPRDAWWVTRCMPRLSRVALGVVAADAVAHLTDDPRVSSCLEVARAWTLGTATDEELRSAWSTLGTPSPARSAASLESWAADSAAALAEAMLAEAAPKAPEAYHWTLLGSLMYQWCDAQ